MEATELKEMVSEPVQTAKEITTTIEKRTKNIPPEAFIGFGVAACATSTLLSMLGRHRAAMMLATWVPTAFALGVFMKIKSTPQYAQMLPELPGE